MSTIRVDTIEDNAGITQETLNGYAMIDQTVSGHPSNNSLNISSSIDGGTGNTILNFTNNYTNIYYIWAAGAGDAGINNTTNSSVASTSGVLTTISIGLITGRHAGGHNADDMQFVSVMFSGDL